jgi:glycosyltransferase involved in cell wall biosynthesis
MQKASLVQKMKADIFIPTSNRLDALNACLASLNHQSNKDFKLLLVGLKKDIRIEELIKSYASLNIDYFIQKRKGLIAAANEALSRASNDIFVRIDDDTVLDPNWYGNPPTP